MVWNNFQEARPSSALFQHTSQYARARQMAGGQRETNLAVAFSNLGAMDPPERMLSGNPESGLLPFLHGSSAILVGAAPPVLLDKRYVIPRKNITAASMSVMCCRRAIVGEEKVLNALNKQYGEIGSGRVHCRFELSRARAARRRYVRRESDSKS